jgi:hypothetical protein
MMLFNRIRTPATSGATPAKVPVLEEGLLGLRKGPRRPGRGEVREEAALKHKPPRRSCHESASRGCDLADTIRIEWGKAAGQGADTTLAR